MQFFTEADLKIDAIKINNEKNTIISSNLKTKGTVSA